MTKSKIFLFVFMFLLFFLLMSIYFNRHQQKVVKHKVYTCVQEDIDTTYRVLYECKKYKRYQIGKNHSKKNELIKIWDSKPRKTPKALALATAHYESSFLPNVYLQEKHLYSDPKDSLKFTDMGLFQPMGFNIPEVKKEYLFNIERQVEVYDSMMLWCLNKANWKIPLAIFYYNSPFGNYCDCEFVITKYNLYKYYDKRN